MAPLGGGDGGTGRSRVANKRVSYPQFVRADTVEAVGQAQTQTVSGETDVTATPAVGRGVSQIPSGRAETVVRAALADGRPELPATRALSSVGPAEATGDPDSPAARVLAESDPAGAVARPTVGTAEIRVVTPAATGQSVSRVIDGVTRRSETVESPAFGIGFVSNSTDISVSVAQPARALGRPDTAITSYLANIGGQVTLPDDTAADGAEVHIIRDNDDTKVATTTTDTNGEWAVTLPGKDGQDPDPPVYSIEVWYRDGPKRDPSATLYNATNRPFIDTADPSETNPYDDYYYGSE